MRNTFFGYFFMSAATCLRAPESSREEVWNRMLPSTITYRCELAGTPRTVTFEPVLRVVGLRAAGFRVRRAGFRAAGFRAVVRRVVLRRAGLRAVVVRRVLRTVFFAVVRRVVLRAGFLAAGLRVLVFLVLFFVVAIVVSLRTLAKFTGFLERLERPCLRLRDRPGPFAIFVLPHHRTMCTAAKHLASRTGL